MTIRIDQRISVKASRSGDTFTGEIVNPVTDASGNVIIPEGTPVSGVVSGIRRAQRAGLWSWSKFAFALGFAAFMCLLVTSPTDLHECKQPAFQSGLYSHVGCGARVLRVV